LSQSKQRRYKLDGGRGSKIKAWEQKQNGIKQKILLAEIGIVPILADRENFH
jgi:hypothetical protein